MNKRMETPAVTKKRIISYLSQGKRFDGRKPFEYRDLKIETGVSNKAEGSARVRLGTTEVMVGVKLDLMTPFGDSPESGVLMVTTELSPMASEKFEKGPPSIEAVEISRIVDRGIRESEAIDMGKLCVKAGEKVWAVLIDIYPINDGGNLIDASFLAAMAALKTAVFPEIEEKEKVKKVKYGELTDKKLPLNDDLPLTMTFYRAGSSFLIDPTTEEEESSEARLSVAISLSKKEELIHAMQKGGDATFSFEDVQLMLDAASKEIKVLFDAFEKSMKGK